MIKILIIYSISTILNTFADDSGKDDIKYKAQIEQSASVDSSKTMPGTTNANLTPDPNDTLGDVAIKISLYQGSYWTDNRYNAIDFKVDQITLSSSENNLTAYKIQPFATDAQNFIASKQQLQYKFTESKTHYIQTFANNKFSLVKILSGLDIVANLWTLLFDSGTYQYLTTLTNAVTFVISDSELTTQQELCTGSYGEAQESGGIQFLKGMFPVSRTPFQTIDQNGIGGPDSWRNRQAYKRNFFNVVDADNNIGIVWQANISGGDQQIHVTWITRNQHCSETIDLPFDSNQVLSAATQSLADEIIQQTLIQIGDGTGTAGSENARAAKIQSVSYDGTELDSSTIDTSESGLNIIQQVTGTLDGTNWMGSLKISGDYLCWMVCRKMHKSGDGLNHQGGIAVIFNKADLSTQANLGQTSGHSFSNFLSVDSDGKFIGFDMGDNQPRGVNMHQLRSDGKTSRLVQTQKTKHGTSATSPAGSTQDVQSEISGSTTQYKWSNDNETYSELGQIVEETDSQNAFFVGEKDPLDNSAVGSSLNASRNIGLARVVKDFYDVSQPSTHEIPNEVMLNASNVETGGFQSFGGGWSDQRNVGIKWLTSYSDVESENATKLKAVKAGGKTVVLWEKWSRNDYINTQFAIQGDSNVSNKENSGTFKANLERRDDAFEHEGRVLSVEGEGNQLVLNVVCVERCSGSATSEGGMSTVAVVLLVGAGSLAVVGGGGAAAYLGMNGAFNGIINTLSGQAPNPNVDIPNDIKIEDEAVNV